MKQELLNLKEKLKKVFIPAYLQEMEKMAKREDPLGFKVLSNTLDKVVVKKIQEINEENVKLYNLQDRIYAFIRWYYQHIEPKNAINIYSNDLINFIEKMAVWYELRYPDYEIDKKVHYGKVTKQINEVMFGSQNPYIDKNFDQNRIIDWDAFYNTITFMNGLTKYESIFLKRPKYQEIVYWEKNRSAHLHLTSKGHIERSEYMDCVVPGISNKDLEGLHIKTAVDWLKERDAVFPENCELVEAIRDYENAVYAKEELLNCVMYRILERGGNRIGPRRAFLFAKEFQRNIDIPLKYGLDTSDPNLRLFVNEYLKAGGFQTLECYTNYFSRKNDSSKLDTMSIERFLQLKEINGKIFYTEEESALHQRLVNVINSQIPVEEIHVLEETNEEKIKRLRIERKLEKARNRVNQ